MSNGTETRNGGLKRRIRWGKPEVGWPSWGSRLGEGTHPPLLLRESVELQPVGFCCYNQCWHSPDACRSGGMADALRSGRSVRTDMWVQLPPSARACACSSVGLECSPAEAEVVGSNPTRRANRQQGFPPDRRPSSHFFFWMVRISSSVGL